MTCFRISLLHKGWHENFSHVHWISAGLSLLTYLEGSYVWSREIKPCSQQGAMAFHTCPTWSQQCTAHKPETQKSAWTLQSESVQLCRGKRSYRYTKRCWWPDATRQHMRLKCKDVGKNNIQPSGNSNSTERTVRDRRQLATKLRGFTLLSSKLRVVADLFCSCL